MTHSVPLHVSGFFQVRVYPCSLPGIKSLVCYKIVKRKTKTQHTQALNQHLTSQWAEKYAYQYACHKNMHAINASMNFRLICTVLAIACI